MGSSGDWRNSTWFTVAFVVFTVVLPAAVAVVLDHSFGTLARATAAAVGLTSLGALGAFTRRQMRGGGRRKKREPVDSPRNP
ncbi:hypothetical protein GCM10010972_00020 [Cellulomonas carbonis]|nr:hypothetical protein GCM10010972_00020 [Cellulomonas carbonis]